jgi:hypothetical protein
MSLFDRLRRKRDVEAPTQFEPDDDAPRPDELVPRGGSWHGHLFDNPTIGLAAALTWTFEFRFEDVDRDYGTSGVSFTVDWVPLPDASWQSMAGHETACEVFAEPIECSAYFFQHHRYDSVRLRVLEQEEGRLRVAAEAHGDVDGMGIPSWSVEQWLDFDGIYVQLSDAPTLEAAAARLAEHTDSAGLVGASTGHHFKFERRPAQIG